MEASYTLFTERTRYIIRLLSYLGKKNLDIYETVADLSEATGIPSPYLGKLVGFLSEKGYLDTRKGPAGGVSLADEPSDVRIDELLNDIGEYNHSESLQDTCCLPELFDQCFVEDTIKAFRDTIIEDTTLEDVINNLDDATP
jgi:Rrf2 family protein